MTALYPSPTRKPCKLHKETPMTTQWFPPDDFGTYRTPEQCAEIEKARDKRQSGIVEDFASRIAAYLSGSAYGQSGNIPTSSELSAEHQEAISRAVAYGHNAAVERKKGQPKMAEYFRECFLNQLKVWQPKLGLTCEQWENAYWIGYNLVN